MPWEETDMGEQRVKFVVRAASGKESMTTLCREFGVSRATVRASGQRHGGGGAEPPSGARPVADDGVKRGTCRRAAA